MSLPLQRFVLRTATALLVASAVLPGCTGNVVVDSTGGAGAGGGATTIPTDPDDCSPLTMCGEECVDTSSSWNHCGGCFQPCEDGACVGGTCSGSPGCDGDSMLCGGQCVNTGSDVFNCGACDNVCLPNTACIDGECVEDACLCDGLCQYADIGSSIPQSVTVEVNGLADNITPECGSGGFGDFAFIFTAPITDVYVFDTVGSVATTLQVFSATCAPFGCNDDAFSDGTSQLKVGLSSGQTVYVLVDAQSPSGTITLNIAQDMECATCGAFISGEAPNINLCDQSAVLYEDLVVCVCEQQCAMQCQDLCSGFEPTPECQDCVSDTDQGCGNQLNDCANDL